MSNITQRPSRGKRHSFKKTSQTSREWKKGLNRSVLGLLALALALGGVETDLFVVLLEGREVLAGLGELALLHALADVPVDERALGVHLRFWSKSTKKRYKAREPRVSNMRSDATVCPPSEVGGIGQQGRQAGGHRLVQEI